MDYFNDFQNIVRSNNIEDVIDKYREWRGRDCRTPEQIRAHADVASVLDAIYASCPGSHAALIRLASICSRLSPKQFDLLIHLLRNGTFTEYAMVEGVTGVAVGQRWKTVVSRQPILSCIKGEDYGRGNMRQQYDELARSPVGDGGFGDRPGGPIAS